ncbi:MAG: glutamine synthetase, partial [Gammaproteobacteria bacterium]|nr:glutamine synthetase [Gammaproteobacteria bacterium]
NNVEWGYDNRTCGLRVPVSNASNRRIENRFAGSDVNPYLAVAATLACGLLGIREKLEPTQPTDEDAHDFEQTMPIAFELSLLSLENEPKLQELMGKHFVDAYIGIKRKEYETFFRVISSWEREYLLMNV